jgi:hypothetical protein
MSADGRLDRDELEAELAADARFERALVWREVLVILIVAAVLCIRLLPL